MQIQNEKTIYRALCEVYNHGAYANIALDKTLRTVDNATDRAYITRVFYGVLENEERYTYALGELTDRRPKASIIPILKMGMYLLEQCHVPDYAAVNKCVELTKQIGKSAVGGFVNAVLRRFKSYTFPAAHPLGQVGELSFALNIPIWLTEELLKQYDFLTLQGFAHSANSTHIRFKDGKRPSSMQDSVEDCLHYGYYVTHSTMSTYNPEEFTPQSLSSMTAVNMYLQAYALSENTSVASICKRPLKVLDLCAAPGGKAVYLSELLPNAEITACDVHAHRVDLICAYAKRMQTKINVLQNDATKLREDWVGQFDLVICDVPCSGIGVLSSKPDIILNRSKESLSQLPCLQKRIVSMAQCYLRVGGVLCYSTCTVLRQENKDVFDVVMCNTSNMRQLDLSNTQLSQELRAVGQTKQNVDVQILPDENGFDGFYIAAARRTV